MAQFSMEIMRLTGAVLRGNQQLIYKRVVQDPHTTTHCLLDESLWKCLGPRRIGELLLIIENDENCTKG
jgi:hypothetical protein